jgi:Cu2+-exporting ATPase
MTLATEILAPSRAAPTACAHCAQPVPPAFLVSGAEHQFCCAGCRAVFETLHACGLDAYYRLRDADDANTRPASPTDGTFESFDSAAFHALYVQQVNPGMASADLVLEGVSCAACVWLLERLPRLLDGVIEARLSLREATVRVTWNPMRLPLSRIARALDRLGYTPHPARGQPARGLHRRETRKRLIHLGVAGALMGNTMLLALALYAGTFGHIEPQYATFFRWLSLLLGTLALAWPGATFFRSACAALRLRSVNLDVPIALALLVGGVAGVVNVLLGRGEIYFDSLTVLVFLLLVGRFIQYTQQRRADDAVGLLFSLTPSSCHVIRDGRSIDVPVEALRAGDLVEVRPGELLPADGSVDSGQSCVNQALLTGESMPASVAEGSRVHAGSQNIGGVLRVRVERVGSDTRVGQLMRLIERGVQEKPPIVQFADKVGGYFTAAVCLASAATFTFWSFSGLTAAIDHTVAFLIVTCPCVLGLATPLTVALAIGRLARNDILVKSAAALERLSCGGALLLDKTGTITEGRLRLLSWHGDESLKGPVAEVERHSTHPVARALCEALGHIEPPARLRTALAEIIETAGGGISARLAGQTLRIGSPGFISRQGVAIPAALDFVIRQIQAEGATAVVVALGIEAAAVAGLGDRIRDDSQPALAELRRLRWSPSIISGDASDVVRHVARRIGVDCTHAAGELSPEQKLCRVRSAGAGVTVMVGDGVNDAAALAAADVGIAVHGGAEASLAAADVYVARPGLAPLVELARMSRRAMRIIRRNLLVSLAYNLLAGALAAAGMMTPLVAAIIMPVSSATVLSIAVWSISRACSSSEGGVGWK